MLTNHNEVGHPVTNMLMSQASNTDMSIADHADGAGVSIDVQDMAAQFGHAVTGPVTLESDEAGTGPVTTDNRPLYPLGTEQSYDAPRQLPPEAEEAFLEIENLVEGARDAIVRRLEQFDGVEQRTVVIAADLVRVEGKLDQLLSHFGLINLGR